MSSYSKEEIAGFEQKDRRIVKQNVLNRATDIAIAQWSGWMEEHTEKDVANRITNLANYFLAWVYDEMADKNISNETVETVKEDTEYYNKTVKTANPAKYKSHIPSPNPEQAKVLGSVAKKLQDGAAEIYVVDYKKLCDVVYQKYNQYPTNIKSVDKILKELTGGELNTIVVKNNFTDGLS